MTGALIILAVTALTGLVLWLTHKPGEPAETTDASTPDDSTGDEECCGLHAVCEKQVAGVTAQLYYDDEELDRFAGHDPSTYTPEEIEEFREVLYTLIPSDVYPWGASLTRRNISLPLQLRDEWIMLSQES
jgi:hypothetical protein